ncbi:hypothetical protein [Acuticoccus kandeliae]|uniref:hypothetical protein n=1 Tax=Acuticoccus kandeliae TaxID=2073160 RepID=UPI001300602F|nr:hypothetical protein [Acuticoccus kandeliae]
MRSLCVVAFALLAGPALASGTTDCEAPEDPAVFVHLSTTRAGGDILGILSAEFEAEGQAWSTVEAEGKTPLLIAHSFLDARTLIAEFTDPNVERIAVSLRLQRGATEDFYAEAGVLLIEGVGAWAVTCIDG